MYIIYGVPGFPSLKIMSPGVVVRISELLHRVSSDLVGLINAH